MVRLIGDARLQSVSGKALVLESVHATGRAKGMLLNMTVEQRFRNPGDDSLEVVYTFPLPWQATLLNVDVLLGEKHLHREVTFWASAETAYETAIAEGNAAIMLEQTNDGNYCLNLGNLALGESCCITVRYAQWLHVEHGSIRLQIPTTIAPRATATHCATPLAAAPGAGTRFGRFLSVYA